MNEVSGKDLASGEASSSPAAPLQSGAEYATLNKIIQDLHWMARRYADMRSSYAPGMLNRHVNALMDMGYVFQSPLYARDGMGRKFDGLTDADVKAAEEDMPRGMHGNDEEVEKRFAEAVAAEVKRLTAQPAIEEARSADTASPQHGGQPDTNSSEA